MCGTVIVGDIPNDDKENFKKFIIEIDMEMSDSEIISKITKYLEDENKLETLKQVGLEWSKNYTQEKYAQKFVRAVSTFLISDRYDMFQKWEGEL
jgi:O-acetylhomoserine/O-acetylserine sulfhydrylase-like pyridoxal-dependent enzyme